MDLQSFLGQLESTQDLRRVRAEVDWRLEAAALCRREFRRPGGGQALLFESIRDSTVTLAANLFASEQRLSSFLRVPDMSDISRKFQELLQGSRGSSRQRLAWFLNKAPTIPAATRVNYTDAYLRLAELPALQSWPGERSRYLTLALCHSVHPETGIANLGLYRAAITGDQLALNLAPGTGAAEHLAAAERKGVSLPLALLLGTDPALLWVAAAPVPANCSEYTFSHQLLTPDLQMACCQTQPLEIPAEAEIVIEGEIKPGARTFEGPFGNHTGEYVSRADCPLMDVTAIRHRQNPVLPATVVGPPPSENIQLARVSEILIREMLKVDYPLISDFHMPELTIFHGAGILALKQRPAAAVKELIDELWIDSSVMRSKLLILVDDDIDIRSHSRCWWRVVNRFDPQRIHHNGDRTIVDATGVDTALLVREDPLTTMLLKQREGDYYFGG